MKKQDEIQQEIIKASVKFYNSNTKGWIDGAMRLGKIKISLDTLKQLGYENGQVLIAFPDNKIEQSWRDDCVKWGFDNPNIKYVNFRSLDKCLHQNWDVFLCDEFHALSETQEFLSKQIKAKTYLFLSGTISEETKKKWPDFKEIYKYTTLDAINDEIVADYNISVHLVNLDTLIKTPNKKGKFLTEKQKYDNYSFVIQKMRKDGNNSMHLALARNRLSLSSIGKMNYLKKLLLDLKDKRVLVFTGLADVADSIGIPSYHSKSASNAAFLAFQAGKVNHLALAAMGKMGVTFKDLDCVILLNFVYSQEENAQILNRCIQLDYKSKIADMRVVCLNESAELNKIKEGLGMLDRNKIKYV